MPVPTPSWSACGEEAFARRKSDSYGYVQVKNPADSPSTVSITVDGPNVQDLILLAYASATPPSSEKDVNKCVVSDEGGWKDGVGNVGPSLSGANMKPLVLPAEGSALILLATNSNTGTFTLSARKE